MSDECTHDCSKCGQSCSDRKTESLLAPANRYSEIKKVIAVVSGKGGVGKSLVTSMLAVLARREGLETAILDADITGPSIPRIFGIREKAVGDERGIFPVMTKTGIAAMSINLLLPDDTDPVVWRGPVIAGTVKQFWSDVVWSGVDLMLIDCPPGTGDVPLTIFQSIPIDGIIVVTSPQELVSMIVEKAVRMAEMMKIPVLGIVENMSYFDCGKCGERHKIYGESQIDEIAKKHGVANVAKIPINQKLAAACDKGMIELFEGDWLGGLVSEIVPRFN